MRRFFVRHSHPLSHVHCPFEIADANLSNGEARVYFLTHPCETRHWHWRQHDHAC